MVILVLSFLGCSTSQKASHNDTQIYSTNFQYEKDQVLVLLVDLKPDAATLRNSKIISGNFKPEAGVTFQSETVRVQYLDDKNQVLYEKILEHPLIQYKEYADEDGVLKYARIEEESGAILLRSQYSRDFKSIKIDYGIDNSYRNISQLPVFVDD